MKKENIIVLMVLCIFIGFVSGYALSMVHNQQFDKMAKATIIDYMKTHEKATN